MTTAGLARRRGPLRARHAARSTHWMRVLLAMAIVAGAMAGVAYGVATDRLFLVAGGAIGLAVVGIGSRAPVGLLLVYVALMPWENAGPSGGAGTVVKLTGLAFGAAYVIHRGTSLRLDAVGPWVWGFVAWACASLLWTAQPAAVTDEVFTLVQLFIVTILVADLMADRPETAEPVMWTYVFSATITSFIGLYMYAVNHSSLPDGRAEAFIGQTAPQFATILLPAAIMLTWRSLHRPTLWAIGGALVVNLAIVLSATRSAWVGIVAAIVLGLLPRLQTGRRLVLVGAAMAVALAMLFTPGVGDLLTERLNTAIESGGTGRTAIWAVGLNVVPEHPIIGIGYGDFPSVINPENVRATILPVQTDVLDFPIGPHNIVVGVLVELGIVGLILLFGVARSLFRGQARTEAAVLARAVMIGFAIQALFLGIANLKQVWLFAAIALGLAASERIRGAEAAAAEAVAVEGSVATLTAPWSESQDAGPTPDDEIAPDATLAAAPTAAIELGPPATKRRSTKAKAAKASKTSSKAGPPEEPEQPEAVEPPPTITPETEVASKRSQTVIQLPGEMPSKRRRSSEVIELPAPTTPPPAEDDDR
jgi:exopolysaccharide production protein ExoQ